MNWLYLAQIKASELNVPKGDVTNVTFKTILQMVFGIAAGAALLTIALAALKYVLSQGNPQEVTKAKDTIVYAVVGLIICAIAFSIVTFVLGNL
jgi:riboflavin transporter FmnP